ncbi:scavenger receptor class B member 1-like [Prorops nasuta]|uniref:scavenger receptor class B member 1-like n=1 Tax=Prorops nasuta TaxID=863751 RepID=UPI0034CDD4E6
MTGNPIMGVMQEVQKEVLEKRGKLKFPRNWFVYSCSAVALLSGVVMIIFWFTNIFRDAILSEMQLINGSSAFAWWQRPPVRVMYKMYLFNYTNVDEFNSGAAKKLKVEELGPYIYRETLSKTNVQLNDDNTVSFREKRSYQWEGGRPDDENVVVPNIPLIAAVAFSRDINFMAQVGLTAVLTTLQAKTFVNLPVGQFLWGYDDNLFEMAKPFMDLQKRIPFDKFGLLAIKNGVSGDVVTMGTGVGNLEELGLIKRLNGRESNNVWGDERCDKLEGTDGTIFPPSWIRDTNKTILVYSKEMCRSLPLRYQGHGEAHGIPSLRYTLPDDAFTSTPTKDSCFCARSSNGVVCPPKGLYNVSQCNFGTPTLISFPHFYAADESLLEEIDGLKPQKDLHQSVVHFHQKLGVPFGGSTRIQINLEVRKAIGVPFIGKLKDGTILPLVWIETGIDKLPEPFFNAFYHAHFTANAAEAIAQWGSLILLILSTGALLYISWKDRKQQHALLKRNASGENRLINEV